jgi:hypothetical protein
MAFAVEAESEKSRVLQNCEALFGKTVDEKSNLYEINELFVIKPEFSDERLVKLSVRAKRNFEFEHPEWAKLTDLPLIPLQQFRVFLDTLEKLKTRGALLKKTDSPIVTNSTFWSYELYENSLVAYGTLEDWRELNRDEMGVRWIEIRFSEQVRARIVGKEKSASFNAYMVVVKDEKEKDWKFKKYVVDKSTFDSLKLTKIVPFQGIFVEDTFHINDKPSEKRLKSLKF